ncbi:MAG: DUF1854 domain-containing protein [bacterium]|nr:DUF1854 domain-containing protein [bacterium]
MLKQTPNTDLARKLAEEAIRAEELLICTDTDINRQGRYEKQWLTVTREQVLVFSNGSQPRKLFALPIKDASEFRCQHVIGSGLLQVRVNGMYVDMLRYSNRLSDRFGKVARKLDRFLQGEPIVIHPEDEVDPRRCPKCSMMLEFPGDVCPRCVDKGAVLARMWKLMRPYRKAAVVMMLLLLVGISLDLVSPQLTRFLVDKVLTKPAGVTGDIESGSLASQTQLRLLLQLVGVLAGVQIMRMIVNILNGRLGSRIGTSVTFDMRARLVEHLQKLSVAYYDRQQVGSLVGRVAYDTEALQGFVGQLTGGFLFQLLMVIGVGIMMFTINAKLAIFTLIPAPLVAIGSFTFWRHIYPRYYRFWDATSKQAGMLSGTLSGIRVVKAFSQEEREMNRFNAVSDHLRRSRRNVDMATATFNPIMGLIFQFGGWIVWFIGGRDVLHTQMTLGSLMAFLGYLWMFYGPLGTLTQFTNWLTQFVTQAHRIFEILDTPVEITDEEKPIDLGQIKGDIKFEKVSFGYNRHAPVLRDIDLQIAPGEMIGVVGRSGSGKTTIVNLICRFYDVNEGRVLIDGVDVRKLSREALTRQVGVVLQEPFLFRGSIWENLVYGKPEATPEEVIASARAANAHEFVMRAAHAYDTWVGERGAGLSGGERQRVGIARVLLTDPRILILDEATSSVDAESEAAIQAALAEVVKGRTTIAIAHRLSTLRNANRILVIDNGRVVETGTHESLVELGGLYARLVKIQGQMTMPTVERLVKESALREDADLPLSTGGPLPDIRSHHPRWLTPDVANIHVGNLGALHVTVRDEMTYGGIFALRCMPVSHPWQYVSLRYLNEEKREIEVGLLRNLSDWPKDAQELVRMSLAQRYLVHEIQSIKSIEFFNGYLHFVVETDLGPMEFIMRWQSHRAQDYGPSGKMLIDTEEIRFLVPDVNRLPEKERAVFTRYIYW